jgi:hypothetical protein
MILDTLLQFSDSQAVTSTGANASTNIIDLGAVRDLGVTDGIWVEVLVSEAVTSGGSGTVDFQIQTDDNSSFSSATNLFTTGAIAKGTLVAGYIPVKLKLPSTVERYLRINYQVATAALTAGKFTAFVNTGQQNWTAYDAVTGV